MTAQSFLILFEAFLRVFKNMTAVKQRQTRYDSARSGQTRYDSHEADPDQAKPDMTAVKQRQTRQTRPDKPKHSQPQPQP